MGNWSSWPPRHRSTRELNQINPPPKKGLDELIRVCGTTRFTVLGRASCPCRSWSDRALLPTQEFTLTTHGSLGQMGWKSAHRAAFPAAVPRPQSTAANALVWQCHRVDAGLKSKRRSDERTGVKVTALLRPSQSHHPLDSHSHCPHMRFPC